MSHIKEGAALTSEVQGPSGKEALCSARDWLSTGDPLPSEVQPGTLLTQLQASLPSLCWSPRENGRERGGRERETSTRDTQQLAASCCDPPVETTPRGHTWGAAAHPTGVSPCELPTNSDLKALRMGEG